MAQEAPWGDTRRSSQKNAGEVGGTEQTRHWGRGLDQRRGPFFREAMEVMVVRASWGTGDQISAGQIPAFEIIGCKFSFRGFKSKEGSALTI